MKISQLQTLPIADLVKVCIKNNVALGLKSGGEIGGLYPLVEVRRQWITTNRNCLNGLLTH